MFDAELAGERAFLVVTQRPFEVMSEYGIANLFCSLHPVLLDDGTRPFPGDFPDNGLVWWLVRSGARAFAEPGRLLFATLEAAQVSGTAGKSWYQVHVDSIEPARPSKIIEIVRAPLNWVAEAREIVAASRQLLLDHPPLEKVYLNWQGHLYGPLRASGTPCSREWSVTFQPDNVDNFVSKIPESALSRLPPERLHEFELTVSLLDCPASETDQVCKCSYRLVIAADFAKWVEKDGMQLVLEGDESLIRRYAKSYLTRKNRQDFNKLLDQIRDQINTPSEVSDADAPRVVNALSARLTRIDATGDELARALLTSGVLEPRLQPLLEQAERDHIEKNTARLQSEIDARVSRLRDELESLERERGDRRQKIEKELLARQAEFERAQTVQRQEFERECEAERERLRGQRQELDRQSEALSGSLQQVAQQMAEGRDALVNQFLAISPLLQQLNLIARPAAEAATSSVQDYGPSVRAPLRMPAFVRATGASEAVSEEEFFGRFCDHVKGSGFKYRPIDLAGFHLSAKCHDMTILGGPPGTGKSSLPRLYTEALLGDEYADGADRYLHVGVSPSWLDMRDLIGQINLLDHCYQPAECGLYPLLIWAQEESTARGPDTRLYLVCLDEMNLAQVEHYFSGFLQALERVQGQREIRCFAPEMIAQTDPFARWSMLQLPPSLRFIGTVNFDETTRQLSQRVLDRCNLILLPSRYRLDAESPRLVAPRGPAVTLRQFTGWVKESAGLDRAHAELLDSLSEPLVKMGCPLNPRRYQAIRRILGNTPASVCTPGEALDLQIAQRVLPQVRNLFRPEARKAIKALRRVLESATSEFPESLEVLQDIERRETAGELFDRGDEE